MDLACGTGLITFPLQRLAGEGGLVVGLDPSISMLQPAVARKHRNRSAVEFVRAVGEYMPFRDSVFDYETVGLALRNFGDKEMMFREARRTLADAGWFLSVDFVLPNRSLIRKIVPALCPESIPRSRKIGFRKLAPNIRLLGKVNPTLNPPSEICKMLSATGFRQTFHSEDDTRSRGTRRRPEVRAQWS